MKKYIKVDNKTEKKYAVASKINKNKNFNKVKIHIKSFSCFSSHPTITNLLNMTEDCKWLVFFLSHISRDLSPH